MKRIVVVFMLLVSVLPASGLLAQENHQLSVANWSFEVVGAVKAPTFSDVVHLGALEDGRHWLVVTLEVTNTSSEKQEIHSDKVQLQARDQAIKQTGEESENVAEEMGYRSIGGSFPHDIDAGEVLQVVQVYKVAPEVSEFTLNFDFNGKWEVPISALVASSAGNPRALIGEDQTDTPIGTPEPQSTWSITTSDFQLTLIGAAIAPTFSGPFHLGMLDDGRSWLVVTYRLQNTTSDETEVPSDSINILSEGEEVRQAGDETRAVASELDLVAPTVELRADEEIAVIQVFKVNPDTMDTTLQVSSGGKWFLNLRPVLEATNGNAEAILPGSALDLASLEGKSDVAQVVPTAAPTSTPAPTQTPEPTAVPRYGSAEAPAVVGETLELDGMSATLMSAFYTYDYNYSTPKGGYVFLIVEVQLTNVGDEVLSYNEWNFAAKDLETDADYDDTFALLDTPLGGGELSPGEFVYGQVALEVQDTTSTIRVKYTVSPGLFSDGDAMYWVVPRQ